MPLRYFICPVKSGELITPIKQCLDMCPRSEGRCLSLPTLHDIGHERVWSGKPSTTMLIKPTRQSYLELTKDYAVAPKDMAFSLLGTRHHRRLELVAKRLEGIEAEKTLDGDETGVLDLLEPDELYNGSFKIIDYKTWGSFSVASVLGLKRNSGHDRQAVELQLNNYRLKVERLGFKVSRLFVQCTVRDGGTWAARDNQVDFKMDLIPVAILDNELVVLYFKKKRKALLDALKNGKMPELCDYEERWGNNRCLKACNVAAFCYEGSLMNKIPFIGEV